MGRKNTSAKLAEECYHFQIPRPNFCEADSNIKSSGYLLLNLLMCSLAFGNRFCAARAFRPRKEKKKRNPSRFETR